MSKGPPIKACGQSGRTKDAERRTACLLFSDPARVCDLTFDFCHLPSVVMVPSTPSQSLADRVHGAKFMGDERLCMRTLSITLLAGILLSAGCGRAPSLLDDVHAGGGTAALIRDCEWIMAEHKRTQNETWMSGDTNIPAMITALRPQVVRAENYDGLPMVDIQTSGGFKHRGLMVFLTNTPPDFVPGKSSWRVTKIADRIFEYRE